MPEQPGPTTTTSRSRYGAGLRYSAACRSDPRKRSRPGQAGTNGGGRGRPAEALAPRPVRHERRVLVAGRDDHVLGRDVAFRGAHDPAGAVAVDAVHARVQAHGQGVDPLLDLECGAGVLWRRYCASTARVTGAREPREPAARVQPQALVVPAP